MEKEKTKTNQNSEQTMGKAVTNKAIEARELIKRGCTVPDADGKCYLPSDETMDLIIQAAIDAAYQDGYNQGRADAGDIAAAEAESRAAQKPYQPADGEDYRDQE